MEVIFVTGINSILFLLLIDVVNIERFISVLECMIIVNKIMSLELIHLEHPS